MKKKPNQSELVEGFIPFDSAAEADQHKEWLASAPLKCHPEDYVDHLACKSPEVERKIQVDLGAVIRTLGSTRLHEAPPTFSRTMAPLPQLPAYSAPTPSFPQGSQQKVNAMMLRDKVIASSIIHVLNGVPYLFNGQHYQAMNDSDLRELILWICERDIFEAGGRFDLVNNTAKFIMSDPRLRHPGGVENRRLVTFTNGTLDIETKEMKLQYDPSLFTTYMLNCRYFPGSKDLETPAFDRLLARVSGGDPAIQGRILEFLGYCLVPDTAAKKGFVLQGVRHSGKSVLCTLLKSFFPGEVVSGLSAHEFSGTFSLSELENRALCISPDLSADPLKPRIIGQIKALSGNDLISAAKKFQSNRQFYFGGKLVLVSNHRILTTRPDAAFFDRLVAIPFPYSVPPEEQDGGLLQLLLQERDGIAGKAIAAYFGLRDRAYRFSGDYQLNSGEFLVEQDGYNTDLRPLVQPFLLNNFTAAPQDEGVFLADVHALFQSLVGSIPANSFSAAFCGLAEGILGAKRTRRRRAGETNPISFLTGIAFREADIT